MIVRSANCAIEYRRDFMSYTDDLHSLSHTKWNCKYHVVFAPKYIGEKHFMIIEELKLVRF